MTNIYIIRHAQAEGNLYRRIHGHYDSILTDLGVKQLECLQQRFLSINIDAVYSSDLIRAKRTAEVISVPKKLELRLQQDLREVNLGVWEDLCWGEVEEEDPEQLRFFNYSPDKWHINGAENFIHLSSRITSAFLRIAADNPGKTVAVVSHGCAIRAFLAQIQGIPPAEIRKVAHTDNTSVSYLSLAHDHSIINYVGDAQHLPPHLTNFHREKWWKNDAVTDSRNLRFRPMDLKRDAKVYISSYRDAWLQAHKTTSGFSNIYLEWAKSRSKQDADTIARAYLQGKPCGIIELAPDEAAEDNAGHIAFFYLYAPYRRKGLAVQLLGYATSYYLRLGRTKLRLKVSEDNTRALAFYSKYGFTKTGSDKGALGEVYIMEKDIERR